MIEGRNILNPGFVESSGNFTKENLVRRFAIATSMVLLIASAVLAADLTGKWSGSILFNNPDGGTREGSAFMDLKQNGSELTGTAGPSADEQSPIQKGKVEGDKITFEVQTNGPLMKFELALVDGHLKGEAKAEFDGQVRKATLDLQRKT
jgi:hypothetical protein